MSVFQNIITRTSIDKGWSGDQKYCAITADGQKYLLCISTIDRLERKRREYEKMSEVAQLGIPMCMPVEFGTCDDGAYSIQSWIDGVDAEETITAMDADTQYRYGWDAGRILAKIHTIPAPTDEPNWETRFNAKIDRKIAMYENCELKYESGWAAALLLPMWAIILTNCISYCCAMPVKQKICESKSVRWKKNWLRWATKKRSFLPG